MVNTEICTIETPYPDWKYRKITIEETDLLILGSILKSFFYISLIFPEVAH